MAKKPTPKEEQKSKERTQTVGKLENVAWKDIVLDPRTYSFRDPSDLDVKNKAIIALAEDILASGGIHTALITTLEGTKRLAIDGHRRHTAYGINIGKKDPRFTLDGLIPCRTLDAETPKEELIAHGLSANGHRESQTDTASRAKAIAFLSDQGWPNTQIAATASISTKTVERALVIGRDQWAIDRLEAREATYSRLCGLLLLAKDKERAIEFKAVYDAEISRVMAEFAEDNSKLAAAGKEIKKLEDFKPVTKIGKKTLDGWDAALKDGRALKEAETIRFHASVEHDPNGAIKLDISGLKVSFAEATLADLLAVYQRVADFKSELTPLLHRKQAELRSKRGGEASGVGREELRNLGFEIVDPEPEDEGDEDPMFDETGTVDRIDVGADEAQVEEDEEDDADDAQAEGDDEADDDAEEDDAVEEALEAAKVEIAKENAVAEVTSSDREWWESEHEDWQAMLVAEEVQVGTGARPRTSTPVLDRFRALKEAKAALKKAAKEEGMDETALEEALDALEETALQEAKDVSGMDEAALKEAKEAIAEWSTRTDEALEADDWR